MKSTCLYALLAVVLIGVSCAQLPTQPASESATSAPSDEPASVRHGEFAFLGPDFTGWLIAPWSPDGTTIAFEVFDSRSWNIYTVHPDGTDLRPLANGPGDEIQPVWSPDGSLVAYMASPQGSGAGGDNTGTYDVYTTGLNGTVTRSRQMQGEQVVPSHGSRSLTALTGRRVRRSADIRVDCRGASQVTRGLTF